MADSKLREMSEIIRLPENTSKNPVSLLMEAAARVDQSVTFNDIDELGLAGTKLFTCEIKVGRLLKCKGTGLNKKMAKTNAAESALDTIKQRGASISESSIQVSQLETPISALQHTSPSASPTFSVGSPLDGGSNPIGTLQEKCTKNNWTLPVYNLLSETGESHTKCFIYECQIESLNLTSQGQGKTKKAAKKISAENMLSMIAGTNARAVSPPLGASLRPSRNQARSSPYQRPLGPAARRDTSSPLSFQSNALCDDFMDQDHSRFEVPNVKKSPVHEEIPDEFCSKLKDKVTRSGFEVSYHDFALKGLSGNYLCLVRLNTKPPIVCHGCGPTRNSAHEMAAKNTLHYFAVCS